MKILSLIFLLAVSVQAQSSPERMPGLRLGGGAHFIYGGDLNRGFEGWLGLWDHTAAFWGVSGERHFAPARWGITAGADILIPVSPRLALGLGATTIQTSATSRASYPAGAGIPSDQTVKIQPSALTLRAALYLYIPIYSFLEFYGHAGIAYYFAKAEADYRRDWGEYWEEDRYDLHAGGLGYHGGLGLDVRLTRHFAFFLEGQVRWARITGFAGKLNRVSSEEGEFSQEGTLYLLDYRLGDNAVFPILDVLSRDPEGPAFSAFKKAMVDFGGYSLNAGLTFRF